MVLGKRICTVIVLVSWEIELFKSVELYLGDGLEMAEHLAIMIGRDYTVTVDSYHGLEKYFCVGKLTKFLYYREQLYDCTRKCFFFKKRNNTFFINCLER